MSILSTLKFVASKKKQGISPLIQRRNKLSSKIFEQIQLAQAQKDGRTYASKQIQFDSKGKNAIEVSNGDELLTALESLKLAVEQGELDQQIEATSSALRAGFSK